MGASNSSPGVTRKDPPRLSNSVHLVTHALPILRELTKQLESRYTYTDRRWEFMRTFRTAATILLDRLGAIVEADVTTKYEVPITELAMLLEELLDDGLISAVGHKGKASEPYPCLSALYKLFPTRDAWLNKLQTTIQLTRRSAAWRELQKRLMELSDQFQGFGEDLPPIQSPVNSFHHFGEAGKIMQLADSVARAVACTICKQQTIPDLRLRLGTFFDWTENSDAKCLCVLISQEESKGHWHEGAAKWQKSFPSLLDRYFDRSQERSSRALKLAILDTGIDASHCYFDNEPRIIEKKSWVAGPAHVDNSGHGTHIAGIVLDLTRNVDLYIARITNKRHLKDMDAISEAIKHAREIWQVDMMSFSFGLKGKPSKFPKIRQEIKEAIHAGILLFAAANNDGGHSRRTYPASHGAGVFCIHAATGEGNKASYNPTQLAREDNYMMIGDNILSCWPSETQANATKYMSGTSFATPVAVSIAAFMIGLVTAKLPQHTTWTHHPKSYEGMKMIFRMLSEERDSYDWVNFPGYLHQHDEGKLLQDIQELLE